MKKGILLTVLAIAFSVTASFAQAFFPTDREGFYEKLSSYLNSSSSKQDREEAAEIMQAFRGAWDSYYDDSEAEKIIRLCELLHARSGGKAYGNIFNYIETVQKIPTAGLSHKDVNNWLCYTDAKTQKSLNGVDKYLASCHNIFVDKVLSAKGNSQWTLRDALWSFPSPEKFELSIDGTLALVSQKDESLLKNTRGIYYLDNNRWEGTGGTADWSRFDIPADKVYVTLPDFYELDLNRSEYTIDSVIFHETAHFNQDILCSFEDKVYVNKPDAKTMFPRVKSYRSDYTITNIMRNIDFEGGIGMMGNQVDVFGGVYNKAVFHFRKEDREVVRVQAPRFLMSMDELLVSDNVSMRVYLVDSVSGTEMDSIYHNGVGFRYDNKSRKMMAFRSEKDFGDGPFHDYFHGVDIFLEAMYWDIDGNKVDFRRMEGVNPMSEGDVVSVNYYRHDDFKRLQGLDGSHPMIRVEKFLQGFDNVDRQVKFAVGDLASYLRYPIEQVISLLLRLQAEGYVEYDSETKWATALPRFFDVVDSYRETIDYDVIKIHTMTTNRQPNLRLDLNTNDLIVYGITSQIDGFDGSAISLSDRKRVVIVPDGGRITFTKKQNFTFSGGILAGMFEFFTKDSEFNYEDFTIKMEKVDSLRFYARHDRHVIPVDGTLERLKGHLEIDRGDNKSSRYETPSYPVFHSDSEGFKFYRKINGGVFHPGSLDSVQTAEDLDGKFYYSVYPFVVDSLNDLSMKNVRFEGELVSGGIMPNIKQPLVVMEDFSLGFVHQIGSDESASYPLYDDLGRFHNKVHLSGSGFFGEGRLDYQTSAFKSDQFMFYLDSVTGITNQFKMTPRGDGTGFPMASADALRLKWDINKPELTTETIDNPICMYGDTYFSGKTVLTPDGYSADGKMRFGLTEFDSDHFALDARTFVADSANFLLYSADTSNIAFSATNYRANVDFNVKKVKYDYLDETSNLDFPMNQYICSLKEAEWDMATNSLHVYNPVESFGDYATATTYEELLAVNNNASKFISLVPEQDSLQFYSMSAEYDMTNYIIHAHDVKIIRVADAAVFPYKHDVDINAESRLEPVSGDLLADTLNQYHLFKNALVNIHSRNYYEAQGTWDYTNIEGVSTPILMDTIVSIEGVTHASTNIPETAELKLSPQFGFHGRLTMDVADSLGFFDGKFVALGFGSIAPVVVKAPEPVEIETPEPVEIEAPELVGIEAPELVAIEVPEPAEESTDTVTVPEFPVILDDFNPTNDFVGTAQNSVGHWFRSSARINPKAVRIPVDMDRIREEEPDMCNGLYYELAIDGGYFGAFLSPSPTKKDIDESAPIGGMLWFDDNTQHYVVTDTTKYDTRLELDSRGVIVGHGSTDLGFDTPLAKFVVNGDYTQYPNDSIMLQGLNIFHAPVFDDDALKDMADVFAGISGESIDLTQTNFLSYYRSENSEEKTEELRMNMELAGGYPELESSDFYSKTLVIPDLKMVWNDQLHAFVSVGKIGLGNFGSHVVNKYVTGCVVFDRRLGNITYYFQDDMFQAFLNYNTGDGQFQIHCTFSDINQRIGDTREKSRTRSRDDKRFQYVAVPYESMLDFLNRLKYAGLSIGGF